MKCDDIEVYLSGYLDDELTQQQRQRVQVHVERCPRCAATFEELQEAQQATRQLELESPNEQEWQMVMSNIFEKRTQHLGWMILIVWSTVMVVYSMYHYAVTPTEPLLERVLVFGLLAGVGLLFISVLTRRLRESRNDRYKDVVK